MKFWTPWVILNVLLVLHRLIVMRIWIFFVRLNVRDPRLLL